MAGLNARAGERELQDEGHDVAPARPSALPPVMALQRSAGNRATATLLRRRVVQRMPTYDVVKATLGPRYLMPTEGTKYKALLKALGSYDAYVMTTFDQAKGEEQLAELAKRLDALGTTVMAYKDVKSEKAPYVNGVLAPEVAKERRLLSAVTTRMLAGQVLSAGPQTLRALLDARSKWLAAPVKLDEGQRVNSQRGGSSEVTEYARATGNAFFKPGKEKLETRDGNAVVAAVNAMHPPGSDENFLTKSALNNERELAVGQVGIDPEDARMANRDLAMYRLNQILGQDVIARAQKAVKSDGTTGSLMDKAKGRSGKDLLGAEKVGMGARELKSKGRRAVNQQDPNLMRLLSKLQVIDLLAFQIDRHPGNYFIQQDDQGNVTGITGIDNDLALGTSTDIDHWQKELPGFSRYVDKDVAERILALDLALLPAVFGDLLSSAEINALTARFVRLRAQLKGDATKLLEPHQWDAAVAKGLLDEGKSYWSELNEKKDPHYGFAPRAPAKGAWKRGA